MLQEFPDGVFFVKFDAITDADLLAPIIAQALGVSEVEGKPVLEVLKDFLRDKLLLLVIDNFEQLVDSATQIKELLDSASRLHILITSRVLLHLSTECEYLVPPLTFPREINRHTALDELTTYEAIRLFVERAQSVTPQFVLSKENAMAIVEICARLDGLPLAIELAAARVKVLPPRAILKKLENSLNLLTRGARDLPARQQTMRGAVEWSYALLSEDEKILFRRLAVFAGGFTLEAAEAVMERLGKGAFATPINVLDGVTSLVDKSLLLSREQHDGEVRFRSLEVVREYALEALEKSGEAEALRHSYADYFLQERDNLRLALKWSLESNPEKATRLAGAIGYFWMLRGHLTEGRQLLEETVQRGGSCSSSARLQVVTWAGNMAKFQGDYETAREMFQLGLTEGKASNDSVQIALANRSLAGLAHLQGDRVTARQYVEQALAISREVNDTFGIAASLKMLGDLLRSEGDDQAARPLFEEVLALSVKLGNEQLACGNLNNLAAAEYGEGDLEDARLHFSEGLKLAQELGFKIAISYSIDGFAALSTEAGDYKFAAELAGAAEDLRESINYQIEPAEDRFRKSYLGKIHEALDHEEFSALYKRGQRRRLDELIALCLNDSPEAH
jgi:non-specific serine/threonine protein kinase